MSLPIYDTQRYLKTIASRYMDSRGQAKVIPVQLSPWHGMLDQLFPWMHSQATVGSSTHSSSD
jgi:hypothetical protein